MRKSLQKALANQRAGAQKLDRSEKRALSSTSKSARKLRKQVIEEDFGSLPIR